MGEGRPETLTSRFRPFEKAGSAATVAPGNSILSCEIRYQDYGSGALAGLQQIQGFLEFLHWKHVGDEGFYPFRGVPVEDL